MTDAQPADQLVAALVAMERHMFSHDGQPGSGHDQLLQRVRAVLPIAREMAEREREKDALIEEMTAKLQATRRMLDGWAKQPSPSSHNLLGRAIAARNYVEWIDATIDRARAAGVEVTGHE